MPTKLMSSSYSKVRSCSFVAKPDDLKKIHKLISDRIGDVEIEVSCSDEVVRTFTSIKKLSDYENIAKQEIQEIRFSARGKKSTEDGFELTDWNKSAIVRLRICRFHSVGIDIRARDDVLVRLRDDLEDIVDSMRPWYSLIQRMDFVNFGFGITLSLWLFFVSLAVFGFVPDDGEAVPRGEFSNLKAQLVVIAVIGAIIGVGSLFNYLKLAVFPDQYFLVGKAIERYQFKEKVQWTIFVGFLVTIAGGLILIPVQWIFS